MTKLSIHAVLGERHAPSMDECCQMVVDHCPDEMARTYARAWLSRVVHRETAEYGIPLADAAHTQMLYILSNMSSWRGETARRVRAYFKAMERA